MVVQDWLVTLRVLLAATIGLMVLLPVAEVEGQATMDSPGLAGDGEPTSGNATTRPQENQGPLEDEVRMEAVADGITAENGPVVVFKGGGHGSFDVDGDAAAHVHNETMETPVKFGSSNGDVYPYRKTRGSNDYELDSVDLAARFDRPGSLFLLSADGLTVDLTGPLGLNVGVMSASLGGDISQARRDEEFVEPALVVTPPAVAVVGATLPAWKILASLFTRFREATVLDHEKRRRLLDEVNRNPGISYNRLAQASGLPAGTARHHLRLLATFGLVESRQVRNRLCFFPSGMQQEAKAHAEALQQASASELLRQIKEFPGVTQGMLLQTQSGIARGTLQFRVQKLVEAGLVETRRSGRFARYYPAPAAAHAAESQVNA